MRVHSSAVERYVHIVEVESSILSAPTSDQLLMCTHAISLLLDSAC